jgi:hypothetical protein
MSEPVEHEHLCDRCGQTWSHTASGCKDTINVMCGNCLSRASKRSKDFSAVEEEIISSVLDRLEVGSPREDEEEE